MTRRPFLFALLAAPCARLRAQTDEGVKALFQTAINAVTARNAAAFWLLFERSMPGYKQMRKDSQALLEGSDVTATVDFTKMEGSGNSRNVSMNWLLEIVSRTGARSRTTRRASVESRVEFQDGKWLIASFTPLSLLAAPSVDGAWVAIAAASAALAQGDATVSAAEPEDAVIFLSAFDRAMPGYAGLRSNIIALARTYQVDSAVELISNDGDDTVRTLKLDWRLNLISQVTNISSLEREETITCEVRREGGKWRVVALQPAAFFAPPAP